MRNPFRHFGSMSETDLGELYTLLDLFRKTYTGCEKQADEVMEHIRLVYQYDYDCPDADQALRSLRNPRNAGRPAVISEETKKTVWELRASNKTIRQISEETGVSRSTVQRILSETHN